VAASALWRRLRRHFGISAPRMAVRTHLPWPWRAAIALALVTTVAGMWWWGFDFAQVFGGFHRKELEGKLTALEAEAPLVADSNRQVGLSIQRLAAEREDLFH
jgi:hypothetical protein